MHVPVTKAALLLAALTLSTQGLESMDDKDTNRYIDWSTEPLLQCKHQGCKYMGLELSDTYERYLYELSGKNILIKTRNSISNSSIVSFVLNCFGASVLDSEALPQAETTLYVQYLTLVACPPPSNGSFGDTLTALNIELKDSDQYSTTLPYLVIEDIPPKPPLADVHFTGLEHLKFLSISADIDERATPLYGFLTHLQKLKELEIQDLLMPAIEFERFPFSIYSLNFRRINVKQLPDAFCTSNFLNSITIDSREKLEIPCLGLSVGQMTLSSPATTWHFHDAAELRSLQLEHWTETQPNKLVRCNKLKRLTLLAPAVQLLPPGWLDNCANLTTLELSYASSLTTLPQDLLSNASNLIFLSFTRGALEALPVGLLCGAPNLISLKLNDNRLLAISSSMFLPVPKLKVLDLSSNDLDDDTMEELASLTNLTTLSLAFNKRVGDVCDNTGRSALRELINLTSLILSGTGITRICRDWRENMTIIAVLDLSWTRISKLDYEDLQFTRVLEEDGDLLLLGTPLTTLEISQKQFRTSVEQQRALTSGVRVKIDAELVCDCHMYWTRRLLERSPRAFDNIENLHCVGGEKFHEKPPEDMTCSVPHECNAFKELPTVCECDWVPRDDGGIVRVRCERVGLRHVPYLASGAADKDEKTHRSYRYQLNLANNNITDLHADDLQDYIEGIDLRNNSLSRVENETADKIRHFSGALWLAGNPLECDCHAAPLLLALHSLEPTHTDLSNAICRDGSSLQTASMLPCSSFALHLFAGLASMLVLTLTVVICLASRQRRFFAKALLHRWGCLWRAAEPEADKARTYDAFLTYSHDDEMVAFELVKRLEPTYKLCVHSRDWVPGQLISDQITESVERSRRTVALVSAHFLASSWAQVEFRKAHATALRDSSHRLIVVMLEEPHRLPLDAQLRHYINSNTYVRWGDPWFWDKLKVALPPPSCDGVSAPKHLELAMLPPSSKGVNHLPLPSPMLSSY